MKKNIYIGVDGGGTSSRLVMRNAEGCLLGTGYSGAANIRLSVDTALSSIQEALQQAFLQANIQQNDHDYRFHIGLGLAGTEAEHACIEFLARLPRFDTVVLESDAVTACFGAHNGLDGAVLIIGTGVIGYKITHGEHQRVGGWGFPYDDAGGGAWLGLQTIRYTLECHDGRRAPSPFLREVYKFFHQDIEELIAWATQATATEYATFAPLLIEYMHQKDPYALELIEHSALALSSVLKTLLAGNESIPVCLCGGLAPYVAPYLKKRLNITFVPGQYNASEGALLRVKHKIMGRA
ncbi:MAG: N-acetylglucosamine kinase [Gammaproteobacteria bacterium]|nr:N-acetylglucosamine kinase [Gammaproteobacteria bacterium]